jgi:uncharacterized membrane protein
MPVVLGRRRDRSRHANFYLAVAAGLVAFGASWFALNSYSINAGLIVMFVAYLGLTARQLPVLTPEHLRAHADEADAPAVLIFALMLAVVVVSTVSLFVLLNGKHSPEILPLVLGIAAMLLGWFAIHTMLGLHYAYEYYEAGEDFEKGEGVKAIAGGLDFPGNAPDGASFVYFSFVIAMTAQVADVETSSSKMRWIVLWHSIFSFFFNTVLLAATVNVVVSLVS